MKKTRKGCHALIVALVMAVFCNFIAFGDEVAAPAESAVESIMDDAADDSSVSESTDSEADEAADADSDSEPDGSESEDDSEPEEKKDDNQSSFDSGNKEDHSSFDEWDFPEPAPQPEPTPEPAPQPEPVPEPEKPEPAPEPTPEPEVPVMPVEPEPTPQPEPEKPAPTLEPEKPEPERWYDDSDDDDDDDTIVVIPKMPVFTAETDTVPVVKTFEVSSGDTLPTPEETPELDLPETPSDDLPKTGDSSLALYAFLASAFGLVVLLASSFIGRRNTDETAKEFSTYPQMCCGPQETEKTGKDVSVKAARSSGTKNAPSRFGFRCQNCIEIVLALTHPGWGLFVPKSR